MATTIKERKQALYDATTKARSHYHAVNRMVSREVERKYPNLEWFEKFDIVEKDTRVKEAVSRLYALCDACIIMGIEIGE